VNIQQIFVKNASSDVFFEHPTLMPHSFFEHEDKKKLEPSKKRSEKRERERCKQPLIW
jgi:hypothetical protein